MKMSAAAENMLGKMKEAGKKILAFLGAAFAGVIAVLAVFWKRKSSINKDEILKGRENADEIDKKAEKKRAEARGRISSCSARDVAESYGAVSDAIADGKIRFRKRCEAAEITED